MNHTRLQDIAGVSHVGRRRRNNEDTMAWDSELGLALVADGVGGHKGGEVASFTAARSIQSDLRVALSATAADPKCDTHDRRAALVHELIRRANRRVRSAADRSGALAGMATTLSLALLGAEFATIANVGDSRVYRMRAGRLQCLTRDHHAAAELVARGHLVSGNADSPALHNVLSRALGMPGQVEPELTHEALESDDLYLLCSDGLTRAADDEEIARIMRGAGAKLRQTAEQAVDLANQRGGRDNVSVILMRIA
jgi:protein phosphatase